MIIVNDCLNVREFKKIWTDFHVVDEFLLQYLEPDMEVTIRHNQEYIRLKIESINDNTLTGKVLNKILYFTHPFKHGDIIQFSKKNVIYIHDITRLGVKY